MAVRKCLFELNPGEGAGHSKKTNTGGPYSKHGIWYENVNEARNIAKKAWSENFWSAYPYWVGW